MKTTYLVKRTDDNGNVYMDIAGDAEWTSILAENKEAAPGQRRYFIADCIVDGKDMDMMVVEVTREEHAAWNARRMQDARKRSHEQRFTVVSLDAPIKNNTDRTLADVIPDPVACEDLVVDEHWQAELRKQLSAWKPWAEDFLDLYLSGESVGSAEVVMEKYGLSRRTAYRYKMRFENFLKNYQK